MEDLAAGCAGCGHAAVVAEELARFAVSVHAAYFSVEPEGAVRHELYLGSKSSDHQQS